MSLVVKTLVVIVPFWFGLVVLKTLNRYLSNIWRGCPTVWLFIRWTALWSCKYMCINLWFTNFLCTQEILQYWGVCNRIGQLTPENHFSLKRNLSEVYCLKLRKKSKSVVFLLFVVSVFKRESGLSLESDLASRHKWLELLHYLKEMTTSILPTKWFFLTIESLERSIFLLNSYQRRVVKQICKWAQINNCWDLLCCIA